MIQLLSCRLYREGDEHGILELMKVCNMKRTIDEWIWEYRDNPAGQMIAVEDWQGQIVGHMAWVPTRMKVDTKIVMGSQAVDLVVHPEFRRHGIFLAIGRLLAKEAEKQSNEVTYGFPNKPAHPGHLKYGWFDVCEVPLLVKPFDLHETDLFESNRFMQLLSNNKLIGKLIPSTLRTVLVTLSFFSRIFNRVQATNDSENYTIHTVESFDNKFDDFWKDVTRDYTIIVCRDKEFLNWRYCKRPTTKYTVFVAEENSRILGYIVMRIDDRKKMGYIVDILAYSYRKRVIQSLILKAIEYFRKENVGLVACWMLKSNPSANVYYRILIAQGFVRLPGRSNPLIARVNTQNAPEEAIRNPRNWYVTIGDSDYI
jgi:GNAT superfamily N-acetyltransferase